jgi:hypothetical protein
MILGCPIRLHLSHKAKSLAPGPREPILTGVLAGSTQFVDGVQIAQAMEDRNRTRVLEVAGWMRAITTATKAITLLGRKRRTSGKNLPGHRRLQRHPGLKGYLPRPTPKVLFFGLPYRGTNRPAHCPSNGLHEGLRVGVC